MILRTVRKTGSAIVRRFATKDSSEPRFSRSAAFQGRGSITSAAYKPFETDQYSSDSWAHKKIFSALGSLAVLILYFGYLREPSDLDEVWSTPPHILTANLERKMLRDQIKDAQSKGMSTELLQAQLDYVDVKEAALRIQFERKEKRVGSV